MTAGVVVLAGCPSEPDASPKSEDIADSEFENDVGPETDQQTNDDNDADAPSVEITGTDPGWEDGGPLMMADGELLSFQFHTAGCDDCIVDCTLGEQTYPECEPPYELTVDPAVHEGDLKFEVTLRDFDNPEASDETTIPVAVEFDFGIEGLSEGETNELTHPVDGAVKCDRGAECETECHWSYDGSEEPLPCAPDTTLEIAPPAENAILEVEACVEELEFDSAPDYRHCMPAKQYPVDYEPPRWAQVTAGDSHTCGILDDESLWCWGDNAHEQLGVDGPDESAVPLQVELEGTETTGWRVVSAGFDFPHTCGVTTDDELYCWGSNSHGQLGTDDTSPVPVPVFPNQSWQSVSAGGNHTCGLTVDGEIFCWGEDNFGQLGTGSNTDVVDPTDPLAPDDSVEHEEDWVSVTAGDLHTCAIDADDAAWCWGYADNGRLGNSEDETKGYHTPESVGTPPGATRISAGIEHSCAIVDGEAYCWGAGEYGRLGEGDDEDRDWPRPVDNGDGFTGITAGGFHTCALDADSHGRCWGRNDSGQLGNSSTTPYGTPQPVDGEHQFHAIAAGRTHTCAITAESEELLCWGSAGDGRLGNGEDSGQRRTPTSIQWPHEP